MISVSKISGRGHGEYYINLAQEDYYLDGGEPPGIWVGEGARMLELEGQVDADDFRNLLQGFDPKDRTKKLVQNAGRIDPVKFTDPTSGETRERIGHRAGWDFTFSAPKSVSMAWAIADPTTQQAIQRIHREAVEKALEYLEDVAGMTRTGKGGVDKERASLAFATFEHGTSRAQDPQLHIHALLMNVGVRGNGETATVETHGLFKHRQVADAIYHAELSSKFQRELGLSTQRVRQWVEIQGFPEKLLEAGSTRRKEILEELKAREEAGLPGSADHAKVREAATLSTREVKEHRPRSELFPMWQKMAERFGIDFSKLPRLAPEARFGPEMFGPLQEHAAVNSAVSNIVDKQHKTHFTERELLLESLREAINHGVSAERVQSAVGDYLTGSRKHTPYQNQAVTLGYLPNGEILCTTRSVWDLETEMLRAVEDSKRYHPLPVAWELVDKAIVEQNAYGKNRTGEHYALSAEQTSALRNVTETTGSIHVVSGFAGAGKTDMLRGARIAWEKAGYNVIGCALAGKAAQGLEADSNIRSSTIEKLLMEWERGDFDHQVIPDQVPFAPTEKARRYLSWQLERQHLDIAVRPSVIVVDEAGMVDTKRMAKLVEAAEKHGARLVLVGEDKQLQAIEWGGAFSAIGKRLGISELTEIRRQTGPDADWQKRAIINFRGGRSKEALRAYAEHGCVAVTNTRRQALKRAGKDWMLAGGTENPEDHLLITGTKFETQQLNQQAQALRNNEGALGAKYVEHAGERIHEQDRVLLRKNDRALGVWNGDFATVTKVRGDKLTLKLDDGNSVTLSLKEYEKIELGYAMTTHKGQGVTVKGSVHVLAGGPMTDLNLTYVQASRAKLDTRFYLDKKNAGEELDRVAKEMARERTKVFAHDILEHEAQQDETIRPELRHDQK